MSFSDLADSYREALTMPGIAQQERDDRMKRVEAKLDLILEKLACVSISYPSSNKPKRS